MKITAYSMSVETFVPMLTNLAGVLDKAAQFAEARKFDSAVLANARLAPDMFPLATQIRIACRHASEAMAVLAGKKAPETDATLNTLADMKALIEKTIALMKFVQPSDF